MSIKTNAIRILDKNKIKYELFEYESTGNFINGLKTAEQIGQDVKYIFKTIVTISKSNHIYVFVVPVDKEIDFKKAQQITCEKSLDVLPLEKLTSVTGYIRGGTSPIGMKKLYPTYIESSLLLTDDIIVSGGKIGLQVKLNLNDLVKITNAKIVDIIKY